MTLRIYLRIADPAARRRVGDLLRKDPDVVLVTDTDEADVLVDDAGPARPVGGGTVSEAGALYHVASVLAKLDAQTRTQAVTKGLREGLLPL